jgi:S-DNA-T family DNA segregation ATPase FtsK/SpoIIIE
MATSFSTAGYASALPPPVALPEWAGREAKAINQRLAELRIAARCVRGRSYDGYGWLTYGLELGKWGDRRERVDRVATAVDDLNEVLTNLRRRRTICRLERTPLALEVPHPAPAPVAPSQIRTTEPHQAELGLRRDGHGVQRMVLDLQRHHHTLIAASSGYGKSVLLTQALTQLATHTPPSDLRLVLIDLKNDALPALAGLPHVVTVAGSAAAAVEAVALVNAERQRRIATGARPCRVVLAIDELAQLPDAGRELLGEILATGRSLAINVLAATQLPTAAAVGGLVARLFTVRLVGRQDGARAAALVAGRPDTGAHELPWPGDFLWIDADVLRFRAYAPGAAPGLVAEVRRKWAASTPAALLPAASGQQPGPGDDLAERAQALRAAGRSRNAICRELWGQTYGGGYKTKLDRLLAASSSSSSPLVKEVGSAGDLDADEEEEEGSEGESW